MIEQKSEPESEIAGMLELSKQELKKQTNNYNKKSTTTIKIY